MQEGDKTIEKVVKGELCTGCGTCAGICPFDAIGMTADQRRGLYIPLIDQQACVGCGVCYDICPGHSMDFDGVCETIFGSVPTDVRLGSYLACQVGHTVDEDMRYNSASGGLVTSILTFAIEEGLIDGALVTRMNPDRPLEADAFIARTKDEIISASKSKYCPVPANAVLNELRESSGRYAVVGLPCHIQGIRKAESRDASLKGKIVARLGIACSMNWRFEAMERLLKSLEIAKEDVRRIDYRGSGWPGKMTISLANGREISSPHGHFYGKLAPFSVRRCTLCSDHLCDLADLSFGDAWVPEIMERDKLGSSFVITRTECGRQLLVKALLAGSIQLDDLDVKKVIESQGNCLFKKKKLLARMALFRLVGAKVPQYNQALLSPDFRDYTEVLYSQVLLVAGESSLARHVQDCSIPEEGDRILVQKKLSLT